MFQAYLMVIPSQVVCFENHAEFFGVLRLVGAVALGWRSGAGARCCFLPLFSPCVVHVSTSVDVHLDSCDRTQEVSFKTVISTAPSSTFLHIQLVGTNVLLSKNAQEST